MEHAIPYRLSGLYTTENGCMHCHKQFPCGCRFYFFSTFRIGDGAIDLLFWNSNN